MTRVRITPCAFVEKRAKLAADQPVGGRCDANVMTGGPTIVIASILLWIIVLESLVLARSRSSSQIIQTQLGICLRSIRRRFTIAVLCPDQTVKELAAINNAHMDLPQFSSAAPGLNPEPNFYVHYFT